MFNTQSNLLENVLIAEMNKFSFICRTLFRKRQHVQ